jgi:hypothetical protein
MNTVNINLEEEVNKLKISNLILSQIGYFTLDNIKNKYVLCKECLIIDVLKSLRDIGKIEEYGSGFIVVER